VPRHDGSPAVYDHDDHARQGIIDHCSQTGTSQSLLQAMEIDERNGPSRSTTGAHRRVKCYLWHIKEMSSPRRRTHHVLKKVENELSRQFSANLTTKVLNQANIVP
jgi:hypothetical protein